MTSRCTFQRVFNFDPMGPQPIQGPQKSPALSRLAVYVRPLHRPGPSALSREHHLGSFGRKKWWKKDLKKRGDDAKFQFCGFYHPRSPWPIVLATLLRPVLCCSDWEDPAACLSGVCHPARLRCVCWGQLMLADLESSIAVIANFWASLCSPCLLSVIIVTVFFEVSARVLFILCTFVSLLWAFRQMHQIHAGWMNSAEVHHKSPTWKG